LLILTSSDKAIKALEIFIRTCIHAKIVFLLLGAIYLAGSLSGMLLLKDVFQPSDSVTMGSFMDSFVVMFMFITAGDNYMATVPPSYQYSELYIWFFGPLVFFGVFFVMSIVIGAFEDAFSEFEWELSDMQVKQRRYVLAVSYHLWTTAHGLEEMQMDDFCDFFGKVPETSHLSLEILQAN